MCLNKKYLNIKLWEWIIFIVCIIIIIYVIHIFLYKGISLNEKCISIEEIIPDNGDLIFLSGDLFSERIIKWWISSKFTHVGMIIRDRDDHLNENSEIVPFIWDSDVGQLAKDGPRVMRLKDKLGKYKGLKIGGIRKLICVNRPTKEDILNIIPKYVDKKMDRLMGSWFFSSSNFSSIYNLIKNKEEMFCSELAAATLQDLNIMKKDKLPTYFSPKDFENNINSYLNKGFLYDDLKYFKF